MNIQNNPVEVEDILEEMKRKAYDDKPSFIHIKKFSTEYVLLIFIGAKTPHKKQPA
jgi:hypothetical protein